jgi:hypothetical protein
MSDWSEVRTEHVREAMAECDRLGKREFLARYRYGRARDATVWDHGEEYDARALLGLAYLRVTGNTVPKDEFATGGADSAVQRLEALGFDVVIDESLTPTAPAPRATAAASTSASGSTAAAAPKARAPRKAAVKAPAAPKRIVMRPRSTSVNQPEPTICPDCFMAIPATGLCDNCD